MTFGDDCNDISMLKEAGYGIAMENARPLINMLESNKTISLFGFPEWQVYQSISKELFKINTYIATPFYIDYNKDYVKNYLKNFRIYYNAEPTNTNPQYGMLGYDIVMYFSEALSKYGNDFNRDLNTIYTSPLQMKFKFKQISEKGGFFNSNLYLTNHNDESGLTVIE